MERIMNRIKDSSSTKEDLVDEIKPFKRKYDVIEDYEKFLSNKRRVAAASLLTGLGALFMVAGFLTDHQGNKPVKQESQEQTQVVAKSKSFYAISSLAYLTSLPIWGMALYSNRKILKSMKNREREA